MVREGSQPKDGCLLMHTKVQQFHAWIQLGTFVQVKHASSTRIGCLVEVPALSSEGSWFYLV